MPIGLSTLRSASTREPKSIFKSAGEARLRGGRTIFLCHSHRDATLVKGLVILLFEAGLTAYVDWADHGMPPVPNRDTARKLQERIVELDLFLYLATPNASTSRWCPWEIGYANGKKLIDSIVVCPTTEDGTIYGAEYLDLYRRLDVLGAARLEVLQPGARSGVVVGQL